MKKAHSGKNYGELKNALTACQKHANGCDQGNVCNEKHYLEYVSALQRCFGSNKDWKPVWDIADKIAKNQNCP